MHVAGIQGALGVCVIAFWKQMTEGTLFIFNTVIVLLNIERKEKVEEF